MEGIIDLEKYRSFMVETEMTKYENVELLLVTLLTVFLKLNQVGQSI